nr:MAG TPA: hypothetical protein [Caudoviricetes sp.]
MRVGPHDILTMRKLNTESLRGSNPARAFLMPARR